MSHRFAFLFGLGLLLSAAQPASAFDGPELYPGERALLQAAEKEGAVVSANTGPGWANWVAVIRGFEQRYPTLTLTYNDTGSGAAVAALDRTRGNPAVDTVYLIGIGAVDAASRGLLAPAKPTNLDRLPPGLRDPQGLWVAVHQMPVMFVVNKRRVKDVPHSWADLRRPDYKGAIVYSDPRITGVGLATALAANFAAGSTLDTIQPGIDLLAELHRVGNIQAVDNGSPYTRFLRGEIPIWITYEMDGLRAKYDDGMGDDVEVVAPTDGTVSTPYAMALVKGARNENAGKLWINYVLSEQGQRQFAEGYVRPSLPNLALPPEVAARLVPLPKVDLPDMLRVILRKPDLDRAWVRAVPQN